MKTGVAKLKHCRNETEFLVSDYKFQTFLLHNEINYIVLNQKVRLFLYRRSSGNGKSKKTMPISLKIYHVLQSNDNNIF